MRRALTLVFGVLVGLAACAGQRPLAGRCPGASPLPCMTREECTEDTSRGCMVCTCEAATNTMPPPRPDTQPE